jgi:hypothetical protein
MTLTLALAIIGTTLIVLLPALLPPPQRRPVRHD